LVSLFVPSPIRVTSVSPSLSFAVAATVSTLPSVSRRGAAPP
jgi:hypothetical protein